MNRRISNCGINVIARDYRDVYQHLCRYKNKAALFAAMVTLLANMLQNDNPKFDRERFFTEVYKGSQKKGEV